MKVNNPNYLNGLTVSAEQINAAVEGGGAGLTPEQTEALGKIEGLQSSASEINGKCTFNENTMVIDGDSIAEQNGKGDYKINDGVDYKNFSTGFAIWTNILLGQRFKIIANKGVGGQQTKDLLLRIQDTLSVDAKYVFYCIGRNDVNKGYSTTFIKDNLLSIFTQTIDRGKIVIATTVIPQDTDSVSTLTEINNINIYLKSLQSTLKNFILIDFYDAIINYSTGFQMSGMNIDGLHPSAKGAYLMGKKAFDSLNTLIPKVNPFVGANVNNSSNLLVNPYLISGTTTPTSWSAFSTSNTFTKESRDNNLVWQVCTCTDNFDIYQEITTGFSAGDKIEAYTEISISSIVAINKIHFYLEFLGAGDIAINTSHSCFHATTTMGLTNSFDGVLSYPKVIVPIGTLKLRLRMRGFGSFTFKIGRNVIRKVI